VQFSRAVRGYVAFLVILAAALTGYVFSVGELPDTPTLPLYFVFIVLAGLSELYATRIPAYRMELSSSIAICLAALFIFGLPGSILLVVVTSTFSELFLRWDRREEGWVNFLIPVGFNVAQLVITMTAAGMVLRFLGHEQLSLLDSREYIWAVAAFATYLLVNHSLVTSVSTLAAGKPFFYSLLRSLSQFSIQYVALCIAALLLTVLNSLSIWHVFLALFPLALVHISFRGWVRLQTEARKTFERMSQLLDARDQYTAQHSSDVAELSCRLGRQLGLSQLLIEHLDVAARVHDIGKVAIPDSILLKNGKLTEDEWAEMRKHPVISAELIEGLEIYSGVADAVRHEHERWDGTGYPDGLKGERIPLLARVIAAADIYDALSTDRPYRKAFPPETVRSMIVEMSGKELDPRIVEALLTVIDRDREAAKGS
jgi:HD-GYP domain-containing protein (c-di-GMP phosphodiesterase class II)